MKNHLKFLSFIKAVAVVFAIGIVFGFTPAQAITTIDANILTGGYLLLNTSDIPPAVNGTIHYNGVKFRCYENGAWKDCISAVAGGSALSSLTNAVAANILLNDGFAQDWRWSLGPASTYGLNLREFAASTGANTAILKASTLSGSTAIPLLISNIGEGDSFRVEDHSADASPFIINKDGNVLIGTEVLSGTYPEKLKVDSGETGNPTVIGAGGDINNVVNMNIQNRNAGTGALSVIGALANNGTSMVNNVSMGIASQGFDSDFFPLIESNDAFLTSSGKAMILGTQKDFDIKFITGDEFLTSAQRMTIDSIGNVGIGVISPNINARLDIASSNANALRIEPYGALAGNTGNLQLMELVANGSNYVGFKAPDSIIADKVWTLPNVDGTAGYALTTDGTGNLGWANVVPPLKLVGTTISPVNAGDDITTSGNIYTTGTGAITSAGLLTGNAGLDAKGNKIALNNNSNFDTDINTGTSTGLVNIGNSTAGAITLTSGAALTLTGGTASSFSTIAGDISIQPAGSGTSAYVQIGDGGITSATPDMLVLDIGSVQPTGTNGAMYYSTATNSFQCFTNGTWGNCDTTGGTATLQSAYNAGATITTAGPTDIAFTLTSGDFTASGAGAVNLTPTSASSFTTSTGALTLTSAAAATWGTSAGNLNLAVNGASTAYVQIGTGAAIQTTPDLLVLDIKSDAEGAFPGTPGAMYYNSNLNDFRCYTTNWQSCGATAASATTLQLSYDAGQTINLTSGTLGISGAGAVNINPTAASQFTSGGALTLTGGASSTWSVTGAGNDLTIDAADVLNLGTVTATGVTIGKAGVTTTNIGTLQTGDATTTGSFKVADGSNNYITLTSPAISADYTLILPVDDGTSGQALVTDGSGNLSWTSITGNLMTTEGDMLYRDGTGNARLPRGADGQILQSSATTVGWVTPTGATVGLGNVTNDAQLKASLLTATGDLATAIGTIPTTLSSTGTINGWVLTTDATQATGLKWAANTASADSLDFIHFDDSMAVDDNTSIDLSTFNLTINGTGNYLVSNTGTAGLTPTAALTLSGGAASTLSTTAGALTITSNQAATWSTTNGNLTLQAGSGIVSLGTSTNLTASGGLSITSGGANALSLDAGGAAALNLGTTNATSVSIGRTGVNTTVNGPLIRGSIETGLTAQADKTQANATQITQDIAEFSIVVADDHSAKLPTAIPGRQIVIVNSGVKRIMLFPTVGEYFNGVLNGSMQIMGVNAETGFCVAYKTGYWNCSSLLD